MTRKFKHLLGLSNSDHHVSTVGATKKRKRSNDEVGGDSEVIDKESFLNIAREVKTFGVTGFDKKFQKKDAQKYAEFLGR